MSVDLPEPEGPMTAVKRPAGSATVTPSRARTAASPRPYCLTAATARAAGAVVMLRVPVVVSIPPIPLSAVLRCSRTAGGFRPTSGGGGRRLGPPLADPPQQGGQGSVAAVPEGEQHGPGPRGD